MYISGNFVDGYFIQRWNRFLTLVNIGGKEEYAHLPNPGRLKELLIPGSRVILRRNERNDRKTKYTIIMVYKGDSMVSLDTTLPNALAVEAIKKKHLKEFEDYAIIQREVQYKGSRFDLFLSKDEVLCFLEVKSVTMLEDDVAMFPDAPTIRGTKHIHHLIEAIDEGYKASILFVIQRHGARYFTTNDETDPDFAKALRHAQKHGVELWAYGCKISRRKIEIDHQVDIRI